MQFVNLQATSLRNLLSCSIPIRSHRELRIIKFVDLSPRNSPCRNQSPRNSPCRNQSPNDFVTTMYFESHTLGDNWAPLDPRRRSLRCCPNPTREQTGGNCSMGIEWNSHFFKLMSPAVITTVLTINKSSYQCNLIFKLIRIKDSNDCQSFYALQIWEQHSAHMLYPLMQGTNSINVIIPLGIYHHDQSGVHNSP
jgi:hypothetical protein